MLCYTCGTLMASSNSCSEVAYVCVYGIVCVVSFYSATYAACRPIGRN